MGDVCKPEATRLPRGAEAATEGLGLLGKPEREEGKVWSARHRNQYSL